MRYEHRRKIRVADVYPHALKGLALPRASHSGEIVFVGSSRLHSTRVAAPVISRTLLSQHPKQYIRHPWRERASNNAHTHTALELLYILDDETLATSALAKSRYPTMIAADCVNNCTTDAGHAHDDAKYTNVPTQHWAH
jgi:hypothetical protein